MKTIVLKRVFFDGVVLEWTLPRSQRQFKDVQRECIFTFVSTVAGHFCWKVLPHVLKKWHWTSENSTRRAKNCLSVSGIMRQCAVGALTEWQQKKC